MSTEAAPGLAAFEGLWHLDRRILPDDGAEGRFAGTARFTRSGPGTLILDEDGTLTMGDAAPVKATRRYLWRDGPTGLEISFGDNRPFHTIHTGDPAPGAVYLCPPDRYEVTYDFANWPRWTARWRVDGPRKAYHMISDFRR